MRYWYLEVDDGSEKSTFIYYLWIAKLVIIYKNRIKKWLFVNSFTNPVSRLDSCFTWCHRIRNLWFVSGEWAKDCIFHPRLGSSDSSLYHVCQNSGLLLDLIVYCLFVLKHSGRVSPIAICIVFSNYFNGDYDLHNSLGRYVKKQ